MLYQNKGERRNKEGAVYRIQEKRKAKGILRMKTVRPREQVVKIRTKEEGSSMASSRTKKDAIDYLIGLAVHKYCVQRHLQCYCIM